MNNTEEQDVARPRHFVQSLERGLAVIEAFDEQHPSLTVSEVARRTGLTRPAARRFLLTLTDLGYMRTDGTRFSLRPRVLALGHAYLASLSLPDIALPTMRELSAKTAESVSLSVLDDEDIVYVAQVTATRAMAIRIDVGTRFPAWATAMGRVLLAAQSDEWLDAYLRRVELRPFTSHTVTSSPQLREILMTTRRSRYAYVGQELDFSLRALAVPIRDRAGRTVASINVSDQGREADAAIAALLDPLQSAAETIERDLPALSFQQDGTAPAAGNPRLIPALRVEA